MHYCAMGSGGSLRAGGVQTYGPRTRWRPWWVLGAATVLTVRPTKALELTLAVGGGYPLIQDSFQFAPPSATFYKREADLTDRLVGGRAAIAVIDRASPSIIWRTSC